MPVWIRAALFVVLMPGAVAGWIPWLIAGPQALARSPHPAVRGAGAVLAVIGWAVLLWCAKDFASRGRGTLAPVDPPRALVTNGLYRFVRNPMYVGVITSIVGQAMYYGSRGVALYAALMATAFHLRVVMYEEPHLAELFGDSFADYRRRVPRWLPRGWGQSP